MVTFVLELLLIRRKSKCDVCNCFCDLFLCNLTVFFSFRRIPSLYVVGTLAKRAIGHHAVDISMGGGKAPKRPSFFKDLREEYSSFIYGPETFPVPSIMETVNTSTIPMLTAEVKTERFIAVNRELVENSLRALNISCWQQIWLQKH